MEALRVAPPPGTISIRMSNDASGPRGYWERFYAAAAGRRPFAVGHSTVAAGFAENHLAPRTRVLVLGCGGGRNVAFLAARGHDVVAVDFAFGALVTTASTVAHANAAALLVAGDVTALPFATASFDGCLCMHVLDHLPLAAAGTAVLEIRRILRPTGRALVAFDAPDDDGDGDTGLARRFDDGTLVYERGRCQGLVFRPTSRDDIEGLVAPLEILSVHVLRGGGHAFVVAPR